MIFVAFNRIFKNRISIFQINTKIH